MPDGKVSVVVRVLVRTGLQGPREERYGRRDLDCSHNRILCRVGWLREFLRSGEVRKKVMSVESMIMLAVSALTMFYLIYALLRPEKF